MLSVLFIPFILRLIPNSALAVILIMIGYKLANISLFKSQYKAGIDQFLPFISTILFMLFTDLLKGVSLGLFIAIIFILKQSYKMPFKVIEEQIDGRPASRQFGSPNIVKSSVAVIGGDTVKARLG